MSRTMRIVPLLLLGCTLTVPARAQAPANPLEEIVERIAVRAQARVVVDPEIPPQPGLRAPAATLGAATALDVLCARVPGTAWRKLYLPERQREVPEPARLAALVRSLEAIEPRELRVERGDSPKSLSLERDRRGAAGLRARGFTAAPVYVLYSTVSTSDGRAPEARIADLQRQQLALSVGEEALPRAIGQVMQLVTKLPPHQMEHLAGPTVVASYRLWDATPPDQRVAMMQQTKELLQPLLDPNGAAGRGGAPAKAPVVTDRFPELARISQELGARFETKVLPDPALLVTAPPRRPAAELPLPKALDTTTASLTGAAWRRLRVPEAVWKKLTMRGTVEGLAAAVRVLERVELPELAVLDARSGAATVFRILPGEAEPNSRLAPEPVHLIVSTAPSAEGRTPDERLASVQRQQFAELFRMQPDQIERSLRDLFRTYDSADPATQKRLMALPMMAGMMGGWFPRYAKEQRQ